jgi:hypothetical protein
VEYFVPNILREKIENKQTRGGCWHLCQQQLLTEPASHRFLLSKMIRSSSDAHSNSKMTTSKKDTLLISRAQEVACMSPMQMRHGCVLARGSKVISYGFNNYSTVTATATASSGSCAPMCSCHAEMSALYRAGLLNSRLKRPCVLWAQVPPQYNTGFQGIQGIQTAV